MQGLGEMWRVNSGLAPEFGKGVRTVLAALLPLVGFAAAHQVQLGAVAALGDLLVSLVEVGPTFRTKMGLMSSIAVSGAIL